jgi:8-oxo-dGTP diphosphatase
MAEDDIHTHVVAVFALVKKGDRYLIAKRAANDKQKGGQWSLPGGKHDDEVGDGTIEATLAREVEEEVGLVIEDQVEYLASQSFIRVSGHHVVGLYFLCHHKAGEAKPLEDQEEVKWVTANELKKLIASPGGPKFLKIVYNSIHEQDHLSHQRHRES